MKQLLIGLIRRALVTCRPLKVKLLQAWTYPTDNRRRVSLRLTGRFAKAVQIEMKLLVVSIGRHSALLRPEFVLLGHRGAPLCRGRP